VYTKYLLVPPPKMVQNPVWVTSPSLKITALNQQYKTIESD